MEHKQAVYKTCLDLNSSVEAVQRELGCESLNKVVKESTINKKECVNTAKGPHICPICYKHFTRSTGLKMHELVHTGERPFECELCDMNFRRYMDVRQHIGNHDINERPYICQS